MAVNQLLLTTGAIKGGAFLSACHVFADRSAAGKASAEEFAILCKYIISLSDLRVIRESKELNELSVVVLENIANHEKLMPIDSVRFLLNLRMPLDNIVETLVMAYATDTKQIYKSIDVHAVGASLQSLSEHILKISPNGRISRTNKNILNKIELSHDAVVFLRSLCRLEVQSMSFGTPAQEVLASNLGTYPIDKEFVGSVKSVFDMDIDATIKRSFIDILRNSTDTKTFVGCLKQYPELCIQLDWQLAGRLNNMRNVSFGGTPMNAHALTTLVLIGTDGNDKELLKKFTVAYDQPSAELLGDLSKGSVGNEFGGITPLARKALFFLGDQELTAIRNSLIFQLGADLNKVGRLNMLPVDLWRSTLYGGDPMWSDCSYLRMHCYQQACSDNRLDEGWVKLMRSLEDHQLACGKRGGPFLPINGKVSDEYWSYIKKRGHIRIGRIDNVSQFIGCGANVKMRTETFENYVSTYKRLLKRGGGLDYRLIRNLYNIFPVKLGSKNSY